MTHHPTNIPIVPWATADHGAARQIAKKYALPLLTEAPSHAYLSYSSRGLALCNVETAGQTQGPFQIDFMSKQLHYRQQSGGQEPLFKAVGIKPSQPLPSIIDATAGTGRDAFLLASQGCQVMMVERCAVLAALLDDALGRLSIPLDLTLVFQDACDFLAQCQGADVIYLDPMFPEKKKSALVKRDLQIVQQLVGHCEDDSALISSAMKAAKSRVVVKRPQWAGSLGGHQPDWHIARKNYRFDVYSIHR